MRMRAMRVMTPGLMMMKKEQMKAMSRMSYKVAGIGDDMSLG
ncbi:hypothetical protein M8C21_028180 [Ambrosia artemisiifolia]|uniref:Uncharacterized protein n=1 Tax=Ambrosia artemisiifolia TaxID=4212 RepID=A0AAD5D7M2_AMBAR|nr:hypothetical protein M8C21_028180 [Ambrosia artemisiifolia]